MGLYPTRVQMIKSPCLNCEKRYPGCHSKCEDYIAFRKGMDERNKKAREDLAFTHPETYGEYAIYRPLPRKKKK